jgi:hypothetical protein
MSVLATWRAFYGAEERSGGPCALSTARAKARAAFPREGAIIALIVGGDARCFRRNGAGRWRPVEETTRVA